MDPDRSESAHQAEPVGDVLVVIAPAARGLSISTQRGGQTQTILYVPEGPDPEPVDRSRSLGRLRWEGSKLVTSAVVSIRGVPVTTQEIRSLSDDGGEMTVQTSVRVEHGYQWNFATGEASHYAEGRDVYVRVR
jgi:hypothetical protein